MHRFPRLAPAVAALAAMVYYGQVKPTVRAVSAEDVRLVQEAYSRPPGNGELAFHLVEHAGCGLYGALQLMQETSQRRMSANSVSKYVAEGRRRMSQGNPCRFCQGLSAD